MGSNRIKHIVLVGMALTVSAWGGHTLTFREQNMLDAWMAQHSEIQLANDADCECAESINDMKTGYGGNWTPVRDYHPYVATGDFNGDGARDFAVVVIDRKKPTKNFTLLVFNGPFNPGSGTPAFVKSDLGLRNQGLFFGPPRSKPYRLVLGRFESDNSVILVPKGNTYILKAD